MTFSNNNYASNASFWQRDKKAIQSDFICRPQVIEMIGGVGKKRIIDIGCGEGYVSRAMARAGGIVTGVELVKKMVEKAIERDKKEKLNIEYYCGDATKLKGLKFKNDFDVAVSVLVFEHLNKQQMNQAVRETCAVLRKGGLFILAVPHPVMYICRAKTEWIRFDYAESDYWREENQIALRSGSMNEFLINTKNHTISDYCNALIENNFLIKKIVEPRPSLEDLDTYPEMWGEENKVPFYLIIKAEKK